ncbi:MAG: selenoneine synthase SenA [Actinomycetota bacterium]
MQLVDWVDEDALAGWVDDATAQVLATVADFSADDDRWLGRYLPIVNPPVWELAHVAWFAEWFVLRQLHGRDPLLADVDERYDSGKVGHRTRWQLTHPSPTAVADYLRRVGDALIDVVGDDRGLDSTPAYVAYAVMHHDAHTEALTYTRQTLDWGPVATGAGRDPLTGDVAGEPVGGDRPVDGGAYVIGASRHQPFVMDNEKWAHPVTLDRFELAVAPVTVAEFAAFVDAGGYADRRLWDPSALGWLATEAIDRPAYWRQGDGGWECRIGASWHPITEIADHPMVHVSWWEADAFCRWAGRRLPTEAEWEVAATTGPDGVRRPWFPWGDRNPGAAEAALDGRTGGTVPVGSFAAGDGPWGHRQLIGNVWEWTATTFQPYPHFEPDAYRDNSEPWFGTRKVLRGGSWATRNRYVRSTFRNYFTPDRRDVFAGFRTCAR